MKFFHRTFALLAVALSCASPLRAAEDRVSPHETVTAKIDDNEISVVYGRPYSKKSGGTEIRKIWGGLVPWNEPWRLGADEATLFTTKAPIVLGNMAIPAGTYSLYLVPSEIGATHLAISKKTGQWGEPVDQSADLAQVEMKKTKIEKRVDQLTIAIDKKSGGGGVLKITWENLEFSVAFTNAGK